MVSTSSKFKQFMKKYGKVAVGVHLSVSAASITGLYIAINNNVDVESLLNKVGIGGVSSDQIPQNDGVLTSGELPPPSPEKKRNRTAELAASSGGAFALAVLCNKALFPIRVPITVALTPPIARFLARRNLIRTNRALHFERCIWTMGVTHEPTPYRYPALEFLLDGGSLSHSLSGVGEIFFCTLVHVLLDY